MKSDRFSNNQFFFNMVLPTVFDEYFGNITVIFFQYNLFQVVRYKRYLNTENTKLVFPTVKPIIYMYMVNL